MNARKIVNKLLEDLDAPEANLERHIGAIDVAQNYKAIIRWLDTTGQRQEVHLPGYTLDKAKAVVRGYSNFARILSARLKRYPE